MRLPPEIQRALDKEHRNRGLSYLAVAETLCGVEIRPLTLRMQLELSLAGNSFMRPGPITRASVFDFLWRLSPHYARPRHPALLRRRARGPLSRLLLLWVVFGSRRAASAFFELENSCAVIDLDEATRQITGCLRRWDQDRPASSSEERQRLGLVPAPRRHWVDNLVAHFLANSSMTIAGILDSPVALLYQLYRERTLARGGDVIDPSAQCAGRFVREQVAALRSARAPLAGTN